MRGKICIGSAAVNLIIPAMPACLSGDSAANQEKFFLRSGLTFASNL